MTQDFRTQQRILLAEASDALTADNTDKAQFLLNAFDALDVAIDEQHLRRTNRQHAVSAHVANRFITVARIGVLLNSMHRHFDAHDLDHGSAGDVIDALVAAQTYLIEGNHAFENLVMNNGGSLRITNVR